MVLLVLPSMKERVQQRALEQTDFFPCLRWWNICGDGSDHFSGVGAVHRGAECRRSQTAGLGRKRRCYGASDVPEERSHQRIVEHIVLRSRHRGAPRSEPSDRASMCQCLRF